MATRIEEKEEAGVDEGMSKLRSLFAVPVLEFNNAVFGDPYPDDLGKSISLANVSYRVFALGVKLTTRSQSNHILSGSLQ